VWPLARLQYRRGPRPEQRDAAAPSDASSGAVLNYSAGNAAAPSNASSGAAKVATYYAAVRSAALILLHSPAGLATEKWPVALKVAAGCV
jgi:hypothetical protein